MQLQPRPGRGLALRVLCGLSRDQELQLLLLLLGVLLGV
jgi:hypothetical protein